MKILLVGEYSRLHNSLKEGLQAIGHEVILFSTGDFFKEYPSDIKISSKYSNKFFFSPLRKAIYRVSGFDIYQWEMQKKINKIIQDLSGFDVVQFINQNPFNLSPTQATTFNNALISQNKSAFLLACGEDTHVIDYYSRDLMKYSILTPLLENPKLEEKYSFSLKYLTKEYKKNYRDICDKVKYIIPTDFDYQIPYNHHKKASDLIPNPVNIDKIHFQEIRIENKINIFHGINKGSYYKKGSDKIISVLKKLKNKYGNRIEITTVENKAYNEYISLYKNSHIFIDQLYSYDQGYNALEAMAAGKCVVTGFEEECVNYYKINQEVAVNASIEEEKLFIQLENLIQNPTRIIEIGKNARKFIETHHGYKEMAQKYVDLWRS